MTLLRVTPDGKLSLFPNGDSPLYWDQAVHEASIIQGVSEIYKKWQKKHGYEH